MKFRRHTIVASVIAALGISSITVIAGTMSWLDKPVITSWSDAGRVGEPMRYESQIWKDGSAEFKVTPQAELAEELLPATGMITVNEKTYKMAVRKDANEKQCLFGSVPVGTFSLDKDIYFTLKAYNGLDEIIVDDLFTNDVP